MSGAWAEEAASGSAAADVGHDASGTAVPDPATALVQDLPEPPDYRAIDPQWVNAARIGGVLGLLPPIGFLAAALALGVPRFLGVPPLWLLTALAGFVLLVPWRLVYPSLAYRRWRYRVDDRVLEAVHGVLVERRVLVPLSRVQHVDIRRGPVDRLFGLSVLVIRTAGTGEDAVAIPGLHPGEALALRDHLLARGGLAETGGADDAV